MTVFTSTSKEIRVKTTALLPMSNNALSGKTNLIKPVLALTLLPIAVILALAWILALKPLRGNATTLASRRYIPERPWQEGTPRWCAELIANPRERNREPSIYDCKRDRFGAICHDGKPRFFSQYNQDIWTWKNHWQYLRRRGVYVDIAANEPVRISNTYFFDKCLNWRGLCVEANARYLDLLTKMRSCGIMPLCVSNKSENVTFVLDSGLSGVYATNKNRRSKAVRPNLPLTCVPTSHAIDAARMHRIDMLSLDVEGHEFNVLQGIDWKRTKVNVIVIETVSQETSALLSKLGYRRAPMPVTKEDRAKEGNLISDIVFLGPGVVWGNPV